MAKITAYAALSAAATNDVVPVVDVSDTSMASSGTTKKLALSDLLALAVQLDSAAADIQPTGTQAAGSNAAAARADHVHPNPGVQPSDVGLIAWTGDPVYLNGSPGVVTAGKINLSAFWIRKTATISSMAVAVANTPAGMTSGQNWAGIYNSSGTQMGVTADQTTVWTATATYDMALTSSFSASPGMYWAAILCNASTTLPNFRGIANAPSMMQLGQSAAQSRCGLYGTGLTTLPGSITPSSIVQAGANMHAVLIH